MSGAGNDPVAVVTGAGSGFGAAIAERCRGAGYAVAVLDIDGTAAERTAGELTAAGGTALWRAVDVADRAALEGAAAEVGDELGRCDLLFANVGVQQFGALDRLTPEDWQWLLSVNVLGTVQTVTAFLPLLRATDGDRHIVLTSSEAVLAPSPRLGGYTVSKAAVQAFGEILGQELHEERIGVTVVFPAGMITNHLTSSRAARPAALGPSELRDDDLRVVSAHAASEPGNVVTADVAVDGLLEQVLEGHRYVVTHGSSRRPFEARTAELLEAYRRMERGRETG